MDIGMVMFPESDDIAQTARVPLQRYDDDLLLANWNPALELLAAFCSDGGNGEKRGAPTDGVPDDAAGFLDRIYAYATHI